MASSTSPRIVLFMFFLFICFHFALSLSSSSVLRSPKAKFSSRKAILASAEENLKPAKAAASTTTALKTTKKKVVASGAKNQTRLLKDKKFSGIATKIATSKSPAATTTAMKTAKLSNLDKTATVKPRNTDTAKVIKLPKISAKKSELISKTKKPSNSNSNSNASHAVVDSIKHIKSTKKVQEAMKVKAAAFVEEADAAEDLISEFRGLPARLQETLVPDLALLSTTSRAYLSAANAGITEGVRPLLGGRWAPVAAAAASALLLLLPLCLVAALVRRAGAYLPLLRRALVLAQAYLAIYFATLALAAAATGLEPLRFFHAASPAAYAWTQAGQSLGYVAYLVLQVVDLVAAFSVSGGHKGAGEAARALSLAQMVVGLAVGLHYYAAVFHRAAAGEAPLATWLVHTVYAACFVVVCACARAERRKRTYLAGCDGDGEAWKNC